ncbi:hypothetical protein [Dyadobacter luticola]|uniref:Uncharacterized protein n=1 Tax=Dyadobacter luticola TaxID=1979387 RepID=A0A5R9KVZ7_9BACT|nr:hypothetical protein [Dyadobacter luticola]TLV00335.1 hypothetical protein FEN17_12625 [Dyadobacter luticola]
MSNEPSTSSSSITTTIQPKSSDVESLFDFLDRNVVGDIITLSKIETGKSNSLTYCSVPQTQCLFSFCDLLGYLESKNREDDTHGNLRHFFVNYLDSQYIKYFPILKKIYRHGLIHSYFPKSVYWGISKKLPEGGSLYKDNSLNVNRFSNDVLAAYKKFKTKCRASKELGDSIVKRWSSLQHKGSEDAIIQLFSLVPDKCAELVKNIRQLRPFELWFDVSADTEKYFLNSIRKFPSLKHERCDQMFHDNFNTYRIQIPDLEIVSKIIEAIFPSNNSYFLEKIFWYCTFSDIKAQDYEIELLLNSARRYIIDRDLVTYSDLFRNTESSRRSLNYFLTSDPRDSQLKNICRYKPFLNEDLINYKNLVNWTSIFYNDEIEWVADVEVFKSSDAADFKRFKRNLETINVIDNTYGAYLGVKRQRPYFLRNGTNELVFHNSSIETVDTTDSNNKYRLSPENLQSITIDGLRGYIRDVEISKYRNISLDDLEKSDEELGKVALFISTSAGSWGREGYHDVSIDSLYVCLEHNENLVVDDNIFTFLMSKRVFKLKRERSFLLKSDSYSHRGNEQFQEIFAYLYDQLEGDFYSNDKRIFSIEQFSPSQKLKFKNLNLSEAYTLSHVTELMEHGYLGFESLAGQTYTIDRPCFTPTILRPFIPYILDNDFFERYTSVLKREYGLEDWHKSLINNDFE